MKLSLLVWPALSAFDFLADAGLDCLGIANEESLNLGLKDLMIKKRLKIKKGRSIQNVTLSAEEHMQVLLRREKIVGGKQVEHIESWPFIGSLGGFCGGALVGDKWFLTAGHCCASIGTLRK